MTKVDKLIKSHGLVILDILLGGLLAYGLLRGMWNGLFVEIASLVSLLLGIFAAIKFSYLIRPLLEDYATENQQMIQVAAFVLTFAAVMVGILLMSKFFTSLADFSGLGLPNRIAGAVFGLVRMGLVLSVTLGVLDSLLPDGLFFAKETLDSSFFYNPIRDTAAMIYPSISELLSELRPEAGLL